MEHEALTQKIIGCAFQVGNVLGSGFLESVYEKALLIELRKAGLNADAQVPIQVFYEGEVVGDFVADIVVENTIVLELKAIRALAAIHEVQLVNYLKATGMPIGLLINFTDNGKVDVRRKTKDYKPPTPR